MDTRHLGAALMIIAGMSLVLMLPNNGNPTAGNQLTQCIAYCQNRKKEAPPDERGPLISECIRACRHGEGIGHVSDGSRKRSMNEIIDAVYAYRGVYGYFPPTITQAETCTEPSIEICKYRASPCYLNLDFLVDEGFLESMPFDGLAGSTGTGYFIRKTVSDKIELCAPLSGDDVLSIVR